MNKVLFYIIYYILVLLPSYILLLNNVPVFLVFLCFGLYIAAGIMLGIKVHADFNNADSWFN